MTMALPVSRLRRLLTLLRLVVVVYAIAFTDLSAADSSAPGSPSQLLLDCYNGGVRADEPSPPADFHAFLDGKPVNLRLERVWWSARASPLPLTIFTMATVDRLPLLEAQCHSYPGPLSAAIYLPLVLPPGGTAKGGGRSAGAVGAATGEAGAAAAAAAAAVEAVQRRNAQLVAKTASKLQAAFSRLESSPAACSLVLSLYSERTADPALAALMPTNALRNAALLPVSTPLAAMVDADLSASRGLGQLAANRSRVSELLAGARERRVLWVLPAWETRRGLDSHTANLVVDSALAGDKASLERLWRRSAPWTAALGFGGDGDGGGGSTRGASGGGRPRRRLAAVEAEAAGQVPEAEVGPLHPFDVYDFAGGHGPTDYDHFFTADAPYPLSYSNGYEPWFITARDVTFPYDERFRGWYGDKFSQILHSVARRFNFWALPDAWIIHRPHPPVAARTLYRHEGGGPSRDIDHLSELLVRRFLPRTKFAHYVLRVRNLEYRQRRSLVRHTFTPQVGPAVARCRAELPWWRGTVAAAAAGNGTTAPGSVLGGR